MAHAQADPDGWCLPPDGTVLGILKLRPVGGPGTGAAPTAFEVALAPREPGVGRDGDTLGVLQARGNGKVVYVPMRTLRQAGDFLRRRAAEGGG